MNLVDMFYKSDKELRSRLEIPVMPVDSSGVEKFTATNPAVMQLSGSIASEYESLTIDNTAGGIALTAAKYGTCRKAFITVETAQIRYTYDGTPPTTTVGHLANAYDIIDLTSAEDIAAFRAIRVGSVSGTIHCTYSA